MSETIMRGIASPNCLFTIIQTAVFYQLCHADNGSKLCLRRTQELDAAFEDQSWGAFIEAEKAWFYINVVKTLEPADLPMSPVTETEDYCGGLRKTVEAGGHSGSTFRAREESLMELVLRQADEHDARRIHSPAEKKIPGAASIDNLVENVEDNINYTECKCSICGEIKPSLYRAYPAEEGEANCDKEWICDVCYNELLADD